MCVFVFAIEEVHSSCKYLFSNLFSWKQTHFLIPKLRSGRTDPPCNFKITPPPPILCEGNALVCMEKTSFFLPFYTTLHFPFLVNPHFKVVGEAPPKVSYRPSNPLTQNPIFFGGREEKRRKGHDTALTRRVPPLLSGSGAERPVGGTSAPASPFTNPTKCPNLFSSHA